MATSFTVAQIVEWSGGRLANETALGAALADIRISRAADLRGSKATDLAFFFNLAYQKDFAQATPGVLITAEPFVKPLSSAGIPIWNTTAVVACADPYLAMAALSEKFALAGSHVSHLNTSKPGIHPSAVVSSDAVVDSSAAIGAHCVIEAGAKVGRNVVLYPGVYLGANCSLGDDTVLFMGVKIYERTQIGARVRIHANSVLGADGFGYAPRFVDGKLVGHQKIFHMGIVVICDDVEIGANTCIDRSTFGETRIECGAKIDNLVMIGHNCRVGKGAVICGNAGLSGSSSVGDYAYVGGAVGLSNQVHVGDYAKVGGMSLVTKDVPAGTTVAGNPQREIKEHFRVQAMMNRMANQNKDRRSGKAVPGEGNSDTTKGG